MPWGGTLPDVLHFIPACFHPLKSPACSACLYILRRVSVGSSCPAFLLVCLPQPLSSWLCVSFGKRRGAAPLLAVH